MRGAWRRSSASRSSGHFLIRRDCCSDQCPQTLPYADDADLADERESITASSPGAGACQLNTQSQIDLFWKCVRQCVTAWSRFALIRRIRVIRVPPMSEALARADVAPR